MISVFWCLRGQYLVFIKGRRHKKKDWLTDEQSDTEQNSHQSSGAQAHGQEDGFS